MHKSHIHVNKKSGKKKRLSKKDVIPHSMRSLFEREAISPLLDNGGRCRIRVRH